ncbi:hypothetical protein HPB50_023680 [Hyalomma asiaticum]|uniref:Uncharacterized protein n=1 Tax=Hyalomma asiaticum TaxID=266040 RepID=A0ACB7TAH2_HYAAI|nr:hypothetical protein HPB50_023680 [Hyalomma asiaticum]
MVDRTTHRERGASEVAIMAATLRSSFDLVQEGAYAECWRPQQEEQLPTSGCDLPQRRHLAGCSQVKHVRSKCTCGTGAGMVRQATIRQESCAMPLALEGQEWRCVGSPWFPHTWWREPGPWSPPTAPAPRR